MLRGPPRPGQHPRGRLQRGAQPWRFCAPPRPELAHARANRYPLLAVIYSPDDPIAALATAAVSSALAVIRVSGPGSLSLLSRLLKGGRDTARMKGHTIHRLVMRDGEEDVDEVLMAVYKAPRSYTGQDSAEIFCHGGLPVIQRVLSLLTRAGFRPAGPGEFTQRAFLNGRMDLTRAEAVNEIVRAKTDKARALALQRLAGAIETRIRASRDALVELRAALEVMIDSPEDEPGDTIDEAKLETTVGMLESLHRFVPSRQDIPGRGCRRHCRRHQLGQVQPVQSPAPPGEGDRIGDSRHHARLAGGHDQPVGHTGAPVRHGRAAPVR